MKSNSVFLKALAGSLLLMLAVSGIHGQIPRFTRIDTGTLVNETIRCRGLYVVDYDMDGLPDLYIGNSTGVGGTNRPNLLFRNEGKGSFTKAPASIVTNIIYEHNSGSNWGRRL